MCSTISARNICPAKWSPVCTFGRPRHPKLQRETAAPQAIHLAVDRIPVDQATIVGYALAYIAAIFAVFLMFLPVFILFALLLLVAAAVQLVILFLNAMTVGLYRSLGRAHRNMTDRWHRTRGGGKLVPH